MTAFESAYPVKISMRTYINHLVKRVSTSPATLVISLIYTERLIESLEREFGAFAITSCNAHRIVLTAFLLAHKFTSDRRVSMSSFGKLVGITGAEMAKLEALFVKKLNWSLSVDEATYDKYVLALCFFNQALLEVRA